MRPGLRSLAGALAVAVVAVAGSSSPAATGADSRADELRERDAWLEARARSATLLLYGLDAGIERARAQLAAARARIGALERERRSVALRRDAAVRSLQAAERLLGDRLRLLYQQGELDPLAVIFEARSLDEAIDGLESLRLAAEQDRAIIQQASTARSRLESISARLARRRAELVRAVAALEAGTATLERARRARSAHLARLVAERRLVGAEIRRAERAAEIARAKAASLASPPAVPTPVESALSSPEPSTITVVATGYAIAGQTATGIRAGWGVVAVDPAVIPLGTRMWIPGYGAGVAADIGSSVAGAAIDVWFPTRAAALAWGRRTVTIRLG